METGAKGDNPFSNTEHLLKHNIQLKRGAVITGLTSSYPSATTMSKAHSTKQSNDLQSLFQVHAQTDAAKKLTDSSPANTLVNMIDTASVLQ